MYTACVYVYIYIYMYIHPRGQRAPAPGALGEGAEGDAYCR